MNDRNKGIFWEARSRILAWYLALITIFLACSIPIINHLILFQVKTRVNEDLQKELAAFQYFQQQYPQIKTNDDLKLIFGEFLSYKIPEEDTFLITIIDGQFFRSNPMSRPAILTEQSELMDLFTTIEDSQKGVLEPSQTRIGRILYLSQPVYIEGKVRGVFIAVHFKAGEIQEANAVLKIALLVWFFVLMLAAPAVWIASGRVLNPLQKLSTTLTSIDESDLEARLTVRGTGEIAELTKRFNQMMERLEVVFSSQRKLLNDVGHELRTPITIIQGHLELMGNDPQEQQETITIVFDELDRMGRLVNNLILLAKAERPDFLQVDTVDLNSFTEEIYHKITPLAQRNWQLEIQGQGFFTGDRQRLTQAIFNLVQNAIRHTKEIDRITLGSKITPEQIYFWVQDTGEGFASGDEKLIFQRFVRAKNNAQTSTGQGLGLSIVQAIVQAHGGQVTAQGELGKGATFTVILPRQ